MNKAKLIYEYNEFIKHFNIDPKNVIVSAGGACVLYGIREETSDIDVSIPRDFFNTLLQSKKYKTYIFKSINFETIEVIEYNEYIDLHAEREKLNTTFVEGVCCLSVQNLLEEKKRLNRPKDQDDIKKLKALIARM
jgi:hypothetical protein